MLWVSAWCHCWWGDQGICVCTALLHCQGSTLNQVTHADIEQAVLLSLTWFAALQILFWLCKNNQITALETNKSSSKPQCWCWSYCQWVTTHNRTYREIQLLQWHPLFGADYYFLLKSPQQSWNKNCIYRVAVIDSLSSCLYFYFSASSKELVVCMSTALLLFLHDPTFCAQTEVMYKSG